MLKSFSIRLLLTKRVSDGQRTRWRNPPVQRASNGESDWNGSTKGPRADSDGRHPERDQEGAPMTIGDPAVFAVESQITSAYERLSLRALGLFVIHIQGQTYGVRLPDRIDVSLLVRFCQ